MKWFLLAFAANVAFAQVTLAKNKDLLICGQLQEQGSILVLEDNSGTPPAITSATKLTGDLRNESIEDLRSLVGNSFCVKGQVFYGTGAVFTRISKIIFPR